MKKVWLFFNQLTNMLSSLAVNVADACLGAILLLITVAVMVRYVFNAPFHFTEEIAGYLVLAAVFLGLGDTFRAQRHIKVDILFVRLPRGVRNVLEIIGYSLSLIFCVLFTWYTGQATLTSYQIGRVSFGLWQVPLYIPQLLMPTGLLIMTIQIIASMVKRINSLRRDRSNN